MTPMIVEHPLLQHKISLLRNKQTGTKEFRDLVGEIATLLCYEATRDLPLEEVEIETPITMAKTKVLAGRKLALVPILRAGMGMLDGMLTLLPAAKVGFIGLYRNEETLQPVEYFCKLPQDIAERDVLVLDPMLATGGSAIAALHKVIHANCLSFDMLHAFIPLLVHWGQVNLHQGGANVPVPNAPITSALMRAMSACVAMSCVEISTQ